MTEAAKLLTADDVRERLRREIEKAGSTAEWARRAGVTPGYVINVLAGSQNPGGAILRPLNLKRPFLYIIDETADVR